MSPDFREFYQADPPSNRSFGLIVGGILAAIALFPALRGGPAPRHWLLWPALALILIGLIRPDALRWPNLVWMRFALLLSKVTNPILTGILFFLVFTPMAVVMRMLGKDPMRREFDPNASTYWISRGSDNRRGSMRNQF